MSGRGIDFLENWVTKNVTAADRKGSQDRATELAAQCYADAAALAFRLTIWSLNGAALKKSFMTRCRTSWATS